MKKLIQRIFIATIAFVIVASSGQMVSAESIQDLQEQIKQREAEKAALTEERNSVNQNKKATESQIDNNVNEQKTVSEQIIEVEADLSETENAISAKEAEIQITNNEIEELNGRIEVLKEEIITLEEKIEKRDILLKDRLRSIQVSGGKGNYLQVIFNATSFADFVSRTTTVNSIMDQDKYIMEEQAADVALLEQNKKELEEARLLVENKKIEQEEQKQTYLSLKEKLAAQKENHEGLLAQLVLEQTELEEIKLSLEEEQAIILAEESAQAKAIELAQGQISKLEQKAREEAERKRQEEERKRQAEASKQQTASSSSTSSAPSTQVSPAQVSSGSGAFSHPVSARINSNFGMRFHPIFKVNRMHNGVDYAVGTGTSVRAAADGVVSTATRMGGFGNVIMISHYIDGQSYTSVYAHLSSFAVSAGQSVSRGQTIANSGNTGNSTGPHLHFEIHRGGYGNAINPRSLLP